MKKVQFLGLIHVRIICTMKENVSNMSIIEVRRSVPTRSSHILVSFRVDKKAGCDWGKLTRERLQQQYSDMIITRVPTRKSDQLVFDIKFKGEKEMNIRKREILSRFYDFLTHTPSMKVWDLEVETIPIRLS